MSLENDELVLRRKIKNDNELIQLSIAKTLAEAIYRTISDLANKGAFEGKIAPMYVANKIQDILKERMHWFSGDF